MKHKFKVLFGTVFVVLVLSLIFIPYKSTEAQPSDFSVKFEWLQNSITQKSVKIIITNNQDTIDNLDLKTIISSTNFLITNIRNVKFYEQREVTYNISVPEYGNCYYLRSYNSSNESCSNFDCLDFDSKYCNCSYICQKGLQLEERKKIDWSEKNLITKIEDELKGELSHRWEQIHIGKSNGENNPKIFKLDFTIPIVETSNNWKSIGLFGIIVNDELYHPWWNTSYSDRYPIISNATINDIPISVNDTYGIANDVIWTQNKSLMYVYCENSGCTTGDIAIANKTDELYWEKETSRTGNSPTLVWDSNTEAVYHLGENSGSIAYDSTTQNHSVSINGQAFPNWIDGIFGYGYDFDGTDEEFDTGFRVDDWTSLTICLWTNHTGGMNTQYVAGTRSSPSNFIGMGHYLITEASRFECFAHDGGSNHVATTPWEETENQWYQYCCIWNETGIFLYTNGSYTDSIITYTGGGNGTSNLYIGDIGSYGTGDYARNWKGQLDEIRVYNKSLNPAEIQEHYWNGVNNLTDMLGTEIADETEGREAIEEGIQNSLGIGITIYTDQQIYIRFLNNTQNFSTFDKVTTSGNKRWAFNYVDNDSFINMSGLDSTIYIWENQSLTYLQIVNQVETLINQTKD